MNKEVSYSDEHWVRLAQNGNTKAYTVLFNRYHFKIQQIIGFYINDRTDAKDLAQEVLLKVYRYLPLFKENSLFSTWLYRITQNTIKNYFRNSGLRMDSEMQYASETDGYLSRSPEYQLITMEFGEQIAAAVSRLTDELRISFGMHIFEGQTYEDIAKEMCCPIGTVRSRIFRARKQIMEIILRTSPIYNKIHKNVKKII